MFDKQIYNIVVSLLSSQGNIVEHTFRSAYTEYWRCEEEKRQVYGLQNPVGCPSCTPDVHSMHYDGNFKLQTSNPYPYP